MQTDTTITEWDNSFIQFCKDLWVREKKSAEELDKFLNSKGPKTMIFKRYESLSVPGPDERME
jgi:hypothetical protein